MNILLTSIGRRDYMAKYFKDTGLVDSVIGTSNTQWTSAFLECDTNYLVPDISDESSYIKALLEICKKEKVGALLSFYDFDIQILSKYKQQFLDINVIPIISDEKISTACFDKYLTGQFLSDKGIMYPATYLEIEHAVNDLSKGNIQYPVFVKPRFGFASKNIFSAENQSQLEAFFNIESDMMVQESLSGHEYSFDILNDLQGTNMMVACKRKVMMRAGETDQAITIKNENLLSYGRELANKIAHIGPMDVDFFIVNGIPYILELNPRFGGGYPITHMAGANYPLLLMKMLKGIDIDDSELDYNEGEIMMKSYKFYTSFSREINSLRND